MTIAQALSGSGLPRADAEVLLARVLGRDRTWLIAHADEALSSEDWTRYGTCLDRRRMFEPVAYIIGEREFYGRPFTVDRRVLVPRPSTEELVRSALEFLETGEETEREADEQIVITARRTGRPWETVGLVADVGTGSGCVGVTLALERPDLRVFATDISADALEVARENARRHGVFARVEFRQGDGMNPLRGIAEPFIVATNPPYIPTGTILMRDVTDHEPHVALFGGGDGADLIRAIRRDAERHAFCRGIVMERREEQA